MKRLLLTTSTLPRFAGDPEPRFVLDLAQALSDRYQVTILAPADPAARLIEQDGRVTIRRYRYAPLRRMERLAYPGAILPRLRRSPWLWVTVPMLFLGLYLALRRLGPRSFDLVHSHWLIPQGIVQALGFSGAGMPPFVVTSHGGDLTSFRGTLMRYLFRLVVERAAAITLVSATLKQEMGGLATSTPVIPMGVETARFDPTLADPGYFQRWCGDAQVLLFVGRLVEKKGLEVLLRALAEPALRATGANLVVVGDGPLRAQLERYRDTLGLRPIVHFLPPVDHSRLPPIYASAAVFCAPSIAAPSGDTDGMPTVILEAAASALPCVGTRVGGIPEFIEDGINGLLVPPCDAPALAGAIARLLSDPALRTRLGQSALRRVSDYRWSTIADRFEAVYRSALASSLSTREP